MMHTLTAQLLHRDRLGSGVFTQDQPAVITTEVITNETIFRDLREEWNELLHACPNDCLFLTWEWMYTWWQHLSENRKLHIIVVRQDSKLIAIAPLSLRPPRMRRLMPWQVLEFLASGNVGSDYLSFLIRPGHEQTALREITNCLTKSDYMLELVRIEKSSVAMAELSGKLQESGWKSLGLTTNYCPYSILIGHTWSSYLQSLHTRHRKNVNRILRRVDKEFDVTLHVATTEADRQWAMDVFVRLHLRRWSKKGGSTALNSKELIDFHRAFSKISMDRGWLKLYTLLLNGAPVASLYVFKYGDIHYHYQSAFDPDYGIYSPGSVILALAIKGAIEEDATEFDFLHDNEEYKYLWARQDRELIRLELYPAGKIGSVYQHASSIRRRIKRLVHLCTLQQST